MAMRSAGGSDGDEICVGLKETMTTRLVCRLKIGEEERREELP